MKVQKYSAVCLAFSFISFSGVQALGFGTNTHHANNSENVFGIQQDSRSPELIAADQKLSQAKAQVDTARRQLSAARANLRAADAEFRAARSARQAVALRNVAQGLSDKASVNEPQALSPAPVQIGTALSHNRHATESKTNDLHQAPNRRLDFSTQPVPNEDQTAQTALPY